jgi:nucleoside-diphosphate-sugar epimerase
VSNNVTVPAGLASEPIGQRILITGGTGFIGTSIIQRLCLNNEVIAFDRRLERTPMALSGPHNHPNVRIVLGNILDEHDLELAMDGVDSVIHLAAMVGVNTVRSHPRQTIETNFVGTQRVLAAASRVPNLQRLVYFSTSEVFGVNSFRVQESMATSVGPVQESRWSYSISKLAGEHLLQCYYRESGLPTVTIRPFNVFGPNRTGDHAMLRFILQALKDEDIVVHGSGDQIRSWCYIDDFVDGVIAALVRPEAVGEDFNLGNSQNTLTIFDLAKRVVRLTDSASTIYCAPVDFADIDLRVPRADKARRLLGFSPQVDIDEGIRRTAAWCRTHQHTLEEILAGMPAPVCGPTTMTTKSNGNGNGNGRAPRPLDERPSLPLPVYLPAGGLAPAAMISSPT